MEVYNSNGRAMVPHRVLVEVVCNFCGEVEHSEPMYVSMGCTAYVTLPKDWTFSMVDSMPYMSCPKHRLTINTEQVHSVRLCQDGEE
jgi:hypothetical protein